jgi:hypothetical protein
MKTKCLYRMCCVAIVLTTVLANNSGGARAGHEGELWLKLTDEARSSYAMGYVFGFYAGLSTGCTDATKRSPNGFPISSCLKNDLNVPDTTKLAQSVTEFFVRFPSDRYLYITDVMRALGEGMSLEQIHKNAGPGGVRLPH